MSNSVIDGEMPPSKALETSYFPHQEEWSEDNLPDILFYLKPPKSEYEGQPVSILLDDDGDVVWNDGKPLKDFPILPRQISLEVQGWLIEAWRRIDPRITYPDILDRQIEDEEFGLKKITPNALSNHCQRECRMILNMWVDYNRREVPHKTDVEALEALSYQNIMLNTILNVCPDRQDRLTKIRFTRRSKHDWGRYYIEPCEVNENNLFETTFPIDHFLLKSELPPEGLHSMDDSMLAAWELSLILQERAQIHKVSHWSKLKHCCLPISWDDRLVNKRVENDTFDLGCAVCTWTPGRDKPVLEEPIKPKNRKRSRAKGSGVRTSKKLKSKNGKSKNASVGEEDDSAEEPSESGPISGQSSSEASQHKEIDSQSQDADRVEDAQLSNPMNNDEEHADADHGEEHRVIEEKAKNGAVPRFEEGESAEDRKTQVVSLRFLTTTCLENLLRTLTSTYKSNPNSTSSASASTIDPQLGLETQPGLGSVDPSRPESSSAEEYLTGVGDHFTMGGGEHPPELVNTNDFDDAWIPPDTPLPEGFGDGFDPNVDFNTLWGNGTGIASRIHLTKPLLTFVSEPQALEAEGSGSTMQHSGDNTGDNISWPNMIDEPAANLELSAGPSMSQEIDAQEHSMHNWDPNLFTEEQFHATATGNDGMDQIGADTDWSDFPPSSFDELIPSLTDSSQSANNASGYLAGSDNSFSSNHSQYSGYDNSANAYGLPTFHDTTYPPTSQQNGKDILTGDDSMGLDDFGDWVL
jgi:hypothetical protein